MKTANYSGNKLKEDSQLQWLQIQGKQSVTLVTD